MKILLIHGANLNMLGDREVAHYGNVTLAELESAVTLYAAERDAEVECFHSNCEGELIDKMQRADKDAVIINAGAYSHYSYALRDCIECLHLPVVEVHLSNIMQREDFRRIRVFDGVVAACFYGEQELSYFKAVDFLTANSTD